MLRPLQKEKKLRNEKLLRAEHQCDNSIYSYFSAQIQNICKIRLIYTISLKLNIQKTRIMASSPITS